MGARANCHSEPPDRRPSFEEEKDLGVGPLDERERAPSSGVPPLFTVASDGGGEHPEDLPPLVSEVVLGVELLGHRPHLPQVVG